MLVVQWLDRRERFGAFLIPVVHLVVLQEHLGVRRGVSGMLGISGPAGAFGADALDEVFGPFGLETFGEHDLRNADVGEAEGTVADAAGQMHVSRAQSGVVVVADAVFV